MAKKKNRYISRRKFLGMAAAGTCGGIAHQMVSTVSPMIAYASPPTAAATASKNLVIVRLDGGCSLHIADPTNGAWMDLNPDLAFGEEDGAHALDGNQVLHPALDALKESFDAGDLAIANLTGLHTASYSHDVATAMIETADSSGGQSDGGWAAKLSCLLGGLFPGVALGSNPILMQGGCLPGQPGSAPTSVGSVENFGVGNVGNSDENTFAGMAFDNMQAAGGVDSAAYEYVVGQSNSYAQIASVVQSQTQNINLTHFDALQGNPNAGSFFNQCEDATRLLLAPALGVQIVSVSKGGFDTHNNEDLFGKLGDINVGYRAMRDELISAGLWNNTIVLFITEFFRTIKQNNSNGSDHGHAGPCFIAGGAVNGRVINEAPNAATVTSAANGPNRFDPSYTQIHWWQIYQEVAAAMGLPTDVFEPPAKIFSGLDLF